MVNNFNASEEVMHIYWKAKIDFLRSVLIMNYHRSNEEIIEFVKMCDSVATDDFSSILDEERNIPELIDATITVGNMINKARRENEK